MPFKITTKGRIKLKRSGQLISEHLQETEAFESAIRHAEANGSGLYTVEPPVRELDVSVLSRVVTDPDTTAPTVPGSVAATALSQTVIRITWAASTDTGGSGLAGYRVFHSTTSGGTYTQVGTDLSVASLSYDDAGLAAGSTHFYRIVAFDGRGNVSSQSSTASATTQASNPNTGLSWPVHTPGYLSLLPNVGGYGMQTVAGSGRHLATPATTVILVNTLASGNSGAALPGLGANVFGGTFEYAWRHSASPKVIIPIVSGWIQVQDSIPCQTGTPPRPGYVTYYGQAAPNPGLFLRGANVATNGASNLVAWHLRSYMGDDVAGLPAGNRDCFSSGYAAGTTQSVVLINCDLAWSVDEPCDFNRSHSQVTLVNCAVIEPLHRSTVVHPEDGPGVDHGFGPIIGSDTGNPTQTSSISLFRNLFAHTTGRTPLISAQSYVHANNLHYNHGRPTVGQGNAVQIISAGATEANYANILGNAFIRGPNNDSNLVSVAVTGTYPAGSGAYSFANAQFGWTSPANQAGFFTSSPSGYVASSLQSAAFPGSWGSIAAVLQWAANPLSPTAAEWKGFVDLMEGTVGAQPRWRTSSIGRVKTVFNQIRDRLNGVAQTNQFVDTVTQAGGWFNVPSVTIDPLNPGAHWHAPLPTGSDRDTPYTTGTFSDGKSRVGYTRLEAWAYEQHLYVTQVDLVSPTVPLNVRVTAQSTTTLRVAWDASTDSGGSGLAGYRVYRSTTSGGTYTQVGADLPASSLSFDDTSLSEATTRFYRVLAFDANGNASAQSATASGTTQATGGGTTPQFRWDFSNPAYNGEGMPQYNMGVRPRDNRWSAVHDPTGGPGGRPCVHVTKFAGAEQVNTGWEKDLTLSYTNGDTRYLRFYIRMDNTYATGAATDNVWGMMKFIQWGGGSNRVIYYLMPPAWGGPRMALNSGNEGTGIIRSQCTPSYFGYTVSPNKFLSNPSATADMGSLAPGIGVDGPDASGYPILVHRGNRSPAIRPGNAFSAVPVNGWVAIQTRIVSGTSTFTSWANTDAFANPSHPARGPADGVPAFGVDSQWNNIKIFHYVDRAPIIDLKFSIAGFEIDDEFDPMWYTRMIS